MDEGFNILISNSITFVEESSCYVVVQYTFRPFEGCCKTVGIYVRWFLSYHISSLSENVILISISVRTYDHGFKNGQYRTFERSVGWVFIAIERLRLIMHWNLCTVWSAPRMTFKTTRPSLEGTRDACVWDDIRSNKTWNSGASILDVLVSSHVIWQMSSGLHERQILQNVFFIPNVQGIE